MFGVDGAEGTLLGGLTVIGGLINDGGTELMDGEPGAVNEFVCPLGRTTGGNPGSDDAVVSLGADAVDCEEGTLFEGPPLGRLRVGVFRTLEGFVTTGGAALIAGGPTSIVDDVLVKVVVGPFGNVLVNVIKMIDVDDTTGMLDAGFGVGVPSEVVGVVRVRTVVRPLDATLVIVMRTLEVTDPNGTDGNPGTGVPGILDLVDGASAVLPPTKLLVPGIPTDGVGLGSGDPREPGNVGKAVDA